MATKSSALMALRRKLATDGPAAPRFRPRRRHPGAGFVPVPGGRARHPRDRREPMTFFQAGIRNVVRIVDFLPYGYGVGLVVLFVNGTGKRLGDLAAGTIVVKDSDYVWLWQLPGGRPPPPPAPPALDAEP